MATFAQAREISDDLNSTEKKFALRLLSLSSERTLGTVTVALLIPGLQVQLPVFVVFRATTPLILKIIARSFARPTEAGQLRVSHVNVIAVAPPPEGRFATS